VMGEYDRAIAIGQRVLALATAGGDVALQIRAYYQLIFAYWGQGRYQHVMDCCRWLLAALTDQRPDERFGQQMLPAVASRYFLVQSLAEMGSFAEAIAMGAEGLRMAESVAHPTTLVFAALGVGAPYLGQGVYAKALPALERAVGMCQHAGLRLHFPAAAGRLGMAYAQSGRVAEAVALLEQAVQHNAAMGREGQQARQVAALGEALLLAGHLEQASALAEQALTLTRAHQERGNEAYTLRLLGDIATHRDPPEVAEADARYRQALALADELGMRPLVAHCHRGLGTLYVATGQREQARTALSTAIALYRAMEMTFWLPQTEAALAQVEGQ